MSDIDIKVPPELGSDAWGLLDSRLIEDLQDPELAPMLSPARYISLLGMDVETLARNAQLSASAITRTPSAANRWRFSPCHGLLRTVGPFAQ